MNDPLLNQFRDTNGELPVYFQKENLQSIDRNRMGYWDEAIGSVVWVLVVVETRRMSILFLLGPTTINSA